VKKTKIAMKEKYAITTFASELTAIKIAATVGHELSA
jgi:hypothetical protein